MAMGEYRIFFARLTKKGKAPYDYQERVARAMWDRSNIVLRAPTGAGKTMSVLAPFLYDRGAIGAARMIYALPLRSLAQGIYEEARDVAALVDASLRVTLQTGEQPDDPFFAHGDVIVTTYDQLLSGMLCAPHGLSPRLHNVNAGAAAGNLVVFDEFHLMDPERAFLTGVACLALFREVTRSVWMTATATTPLVEVLRRALDAREIELSDSEIAALPSLSRVTRVIQRECVELNAEAVLRYPASKSLVVVNQVRRAQELYREVYNLAQKRGIETPVELLHARFFRSDRLAKQRFAARHFDEHSAGPAILIATQVVEAGLNLSCEHLHTEVCPMNSLVQRAGRCARFEGESGTVHVYPLTEDRARPYAKQELETTWALLGDAPVRADPDRVRAWVEAAHRESDEQGTRGGWKARLAECRQRIWGSITGRGPGVADLIRGHSDTVQVIVHDSPQGCRPTCLEGVTVYRSRLRTLVKQADWVGWVYAPETAERWIRLEGEEQISGAYAVCLRPQVARYTGALGLELGVPGEGRSPARDPVQRPGYAALTKEQWSKHTVGVVREAQRRLGTELVPGGLLAQGFGERALRELVVAAAFLHDLGKLQQRWQAWAEAWQRRLDAGYVHEQLLAHTDFDPDNPEHWKSEREVTPRRPHHALAGAYYGEALLPRLAPSADEVGALAWWASVVAHHGGSIEDEDQVLPLDGRWREAVAERWREAVGELTDLQLPELTAPTPAAVVRGSHQKSDRCVREFERWWPLAAYLTRNLRLSDQRATEEGISDG